MLKGGLFAPLVYKNIALRQFSDIDYLIPKTNISKASEILSDLGYVQGKYDINSKNIIPSTRKEKLFHQMNSHEVIEFLKKNPYNGSQIYNIDINFDIFWKGGNDKFGNFNVDYLFDDASLVKFNNSFVFSLSENDQIIQLCAHLYSEAVQIFWHGNWMRDKGDLHLIKFCDLYEFISNHNINWTLLLNRIKQTKTEESTYYSLTLLNRLFDETVPNEFLNQLNIDECILDIYYDKKGVERQWNTCFEDRMFEINRKVNELEILNIGG